MPTLEDEVANSVSHTHLLLVGDTKMGKTDYVAQAALDGYQVLYVDRDNGLATMKEVLANQPEAMRRIQYFSPNNLAEFMENLLTLPVVRYNSRTKVAPAFSDKSDDTIVELYPSRFPSNLILALDSYTALTLSAMENKAKDRRVSLTDIDKYSRELYSGTGFLMTQLLSIMQKVRFHTVVMGHPGVYERKEKPPNRRAEDVKEADMIIRETTKIPLSTSMPHGATLGKFFNQIGWLEINNLDQRFLDFTVQQGRMGGGTPNKKGDPRGSMRFSKLFGEAGEYPPVDTWMATMTSEEMKLKAQAGSGIKLGTPKPTAPAAEGETPTPEQAKPPQTSFSKLKFGKTT